MSKPETIEDVILNLRNRAAARRKSGKLLLVDDAMFDKIADSIEEAITHQFRGLTKKEGQ